jgi:hypothetical protein
MNKIFFNLFKSKSQQKVEWINGEWVIPDWLKGTNLPLLQQEYVRPSNRCTKWILLAGNVYADTDYSGGVLIEARDLIAWITRHAKNTSTSVLAEQQAKEYMPTWLALADDFDETVTILDAEMKSVVHDYIGDFKSEGLAKYYCTTCKLTYEELINIKHDSKKSGNWSSWKNEWHCVQGHKFFYKEYRMHFYPSERKNEL